MLQYTLFSVVFAARLLKFSMGQIILITQAYGAVVYLPKIFFNNGHYLWMLQILSL